MSRLRGWLFVLVASLSPAPVLALQDFAQSGPHQVGLREVQIPRADGSEFGALLVYPAAQEGVDAAPDASAGPYPAVVFAHGFLSPPSLYLATLRQLASWGFVVVAPSSGLELFPSHPAFAADLSFAIDWLQGIGMTGRPGSGSDWVGMVDGAAFGASGHSMGGGVAVLAAANDGRIGALGLLAPARTFPVSSIDQAAVLTVPTLIMAGTRDTITPLSRHAGPLFAALEASRQLALVLGGSHCGFVSVPLPAAVCGEASISLQEQLDAVARSLVPFFLYHLAGRDDLEAQVWGRSRVWQSPVLTLLDR